MLRAETVLGGAADEWAEYSRFDAGNSVKLCLQPGQSEICLKAAAVSGSTDLWSPFVVLQVQCVLATEAVFVEVAGIPRFYIDIIKAVPFISRPCKAVSRPNLQCETRRLGSDFVMDDNYYDVDNLHLLFASSQACQIR